MGIMSAFFGRILQETRYQEQARIAKEQERYYAAMQRPEVVRVNMGAIDYVKFISTFKGINT